MRSPCHYTVVNEKKPTYPTIARRIKGLAPSFHAKIILASSATSWDIRTIGLPESTNEKECD